MYKINQPLVTVAMPAYNHEDYIEEAINSVIDQTYQYIEFIIINDGSRDKTGDIIKSLEIKCKNRFADYVYIEQENQGISYTLNKILAMAQGEYFIITSSDDTQSKTRVEEKINFFLQNLEYDFCYSGYNDIDCTGKVINSTVPKDCFELNFEDIIFRKSFYSYFSYMAKTIALKELGGFLDGVKIEDLELALRLTYNNRRAMFLNKLLYNHRLHNNNTVKKLNYMKTGMFEILNMYNQHKLYPEALRFWQERYQKRNYHEFINDAYTIISKYNDSSFKIIIYGHGAFGKMIAALIPNSSYCFVDQSASKQFTTFKQGQIYTKDALYKIQFDYIFISPLWLDVNIKSELLNTYNIDSSKIITFESSELA